MPPAHTWLTQSVPAKQPPPGAHGPQVPPQSTSVSDPFFTLSAQVGTWQVPPTHTWLLQSVGTRHPRPELQAGQAAPPQSMELSEPFCTKSVQVAAWHTVRQTWVVQSAATEHAWPAAHAPHGLDPPQSTPDSLPFEIPS